MKICELHPMKNFITFFCFLQVQNHQQDAGLLIKQDNCSRKGQSKDIGFTVLPDTIDKSKDGKSDLEENKGRTIWPTNTITFGAAKEKPDVAGTVAGFRRFELGL